MRGSGTVVAKVRDGMGVGVRGGGGEIPLPRECSVRVGDVRCLGAAFFSV